jgi:hypothetical protein
VRIDTRVATRTRCNCCGDVGQKSHTFKRLRTQIVVKLLESDPSLQVQSARFSLARVMECARAPLVLRGPSVGRLHRSVGCTAQLDALLGWLHVEVSYRLCRFYWKRCSVGW